MGKRGRFAPLPNCARPPAPALRSRAGRADKPVTNARAARMATSDFHGDKSGSRSRYQSASAVATSESRVSSHFAFRTITAVRAVHFF